MWRHYYTKWSDLTLERMDPRLVELVPDLAALAPPAIVIDKTTYSPWMDAALERALRAVQADTLVISGAETDVCVLATVLGAVDRGYRVVIPADALCSSSDEMHDALLALYNGRYALQIEVVTSREILAEWSGQAPPQARA
jgi:nicotinamidase-related amidase